MLLLSAIEKVIRLTARRARLSYVLHGVCVGWMLGAGAAAVFLSVVWWFRLDAQWWQPTVFAAAMAMIGLLWGTHRHLSESAVAMWIDRHAQTQERLSTARWLSSREERGGLEQLQITDAENCAAQLNWRRLARVPIPRALWGALALTGAAVFLWFAPDIPWLQSHQTRQEKQAMKAAGEQAQQMAQEWRKRAKGQDREKMRQLAAELEALGKQMKRARMSKREALVKMSRLQKQAEEEQRRLAEANSPKSLQRASNEFLSARNVQQQLKQAKLEHELSQKLRTADLRQKSQQKPQTAIHEAARKSTPFANEMAKQMALSLSQQDAQKLGELLQRIAEQWNQLSPEERQKLQEILRELAKALECTNLDAASKELLEALRNIELGDMQQAVKWMQKAGGT